MNLLNEASNSKFVTRKWNIFKDQSNANYDAGNEIIYNTELLKRNFCDYNDSYMLMRYISIIGDNGHQVAIKNYAQFINCITKIDGTTKNDAEDLDLVMSMYNLLEYSLHYSDTTGSLQFYSTDEATHVVADIGNNAAFKSFMYKTELVG